MSLVVREAPIIPKVLINLRAFKAQNVANTASLRDELPSVRSSDSPVTCVLEVYKKLR